MQTLKFKTQPTISLFAAINHKPMNLEKQKQTKWIEILTDMTTDPVKVNVCFP